jgi:hypothetical protein
VEGVSPGNPLRTSSFHGDISRAFPRALVKRRAMETLLAITDPITDLGPAPLLAAFLKKRSTEVIPRFTVLTKCSTLFRS